MGQKMLSFDEINRLGQIIDSTFGKSSSYTGQTSVKASLAGNVLTVNMICVITLASDVPQRDQITTHREAAQTVVNQYMKKVREEFKELAGRALKVKESTVGDSVEIVSASPYVLKRSAYYRFNATFSVD
jgi:hypothetical protein